MIPVILFAIVYGLHEANIYAKGYEGGHYILLNKFSLYHVLMATLFIIFSSSIVGWTFFKYIPIFAVIEDIFYWIGMKLLKKPDKLDENSWVNFGFGGFKLFNQWIPNTYWLWLAVYAVLEYLF